MVYFRLVERDVRAQVVEAVGVHGGALGAGPDDDEVPVPAREDVERVEDLLALGAAPSTIRRMVIAEGLRVTAFGVAGGLLLLISSRLRML